MATITDDIAYYIKYKSFDYSNNDLANKFNIDSEIIRNIRKNNSWLHIKNDELDKLIVNDVITYKESKFKNLDTRNREIIKQDIKNGISFKEINSKYGISKRTFYNYKNSLL